MPIGAAMIEKGGLSPVEAGTNTAYDAVNTEDKALSGWLPSHGSPDVDLVHEQPELNAKSRDLYRNDPVAASVIRTSQDSIIGHILKLVANVDYLALGWTKEKAREWNKATETEFKSYSETTECHAARRMNLHGIALQAYRGFLYNGNAVTLPIWDTSRKFDRWGTKLQNIESDRLETPPEKTAEERVNGGVHSDNYGAALGYYIRKVHPGQIYGLKSITDYSRFQYVPAFTKWGRRRVIHFYEETRAGQSVGSNVFASVIKQFKLAGMGMDYEMQSVIVNSLVSAFIESDLPEQVLVNSFGSDPANKWADQNKRNKVTLKGGTIPVLPIGATLKGFTPSRPNNAFSEFQKTALKRIAAGTGLSYEVLLKDFSDVSYAGARSTMLELWRHFLTRRQEFTTGWLQPVYELWLEEAVNRGRVDAPDFYNKKFAYIRSRWIMTGRGWVDPVKEAKGAVIRMDAGLSTMQKECAEQGDDWEEVLDQLEIEMREIESRGLTQHIKGNAQSAYQEPVEPEAAKA